MLYEVITLDRIETRRTARRKISEQDTDECRKAECEQNHARIRNEWDRQPERTRERKRQTQNRITSYNVCYTKLLRTTRLALQCDDFESEI